jgi:hypothetical protein
MPGILASYAVLVSVLTFATLFERGHQTIWPPAVLHLAADCIIPLGALGVAPPTAIVYWMGAQVGACSIAYALVRRVGSRDAASDTPAQRRHQPGTADA